MRPTLRATSFSADNAAKATMSGVRPSWLSCGRRALQKSKYTAKLCRAALTPS
jgi:hypothetical protein